MVTGGLAGPMTFTPTQYATAIRKLHLAADAAIEGLYDRADSQFKREMRSASLIRHVEALVETLGYRVERLAATEDDGDAAEERAAS